MTNAIAVILATSLSFYTSHLYILSTLVLSIYIAVYTTCQIDTTNRSADVHPFC
jgi:uncharacterized membrane protein YgaE (UPF0421/DUF939 family)